MLEKGGDGEVAVKKSELCFGGFWPFGVRERVMGRH